MATISHEIPRVYDVEAGHVNPQEIKAMTPAMPTTAVADKPIVALSANLAQLLPSGTVMVYQMLASSFSNKGKCYNTNWYITVALLVVLALCSVFFIWTDCVVHNGKLYYGLAIYGRLNVFNLSKKEQLVLFADIMPELSRRGLRRLDFFHAFLVVLVFLAMAFTDVEIQNCFFPDAGNEIQQLLKNLPLGITVFASLVFSIFPTRRKFIGTAA
ncbi:hypothetical protein CFC21_106252 [Triticum aestivum]|uniref:Uncharacterized protein n=2 Tax=Triticum aestivum TaxID=4565 RepID=A0A9R1MDV5_WHEAT|nr:hypothetical protein CFC21_106252 [Triticum aestivum]